MRNLTASLSCIIVSLMLFGPIQAFAADDASAFISRLTAELEIALQEGREKGLLEDEKYIDTLIDQYIIPHIDIELMSKRIFSQRWNEIVAQNKNLQAYNAILGSLRRTYRFALAAYNGQPIDIHNNTKHTKYSVVRILIRTDDNGHTIDLALRQLGDSWRIFDFSVDGVVVSKILNSAIKRSLEADDIDTVISTISPQTEP